MRLLVSLLVSCGACSPAGQSTPRHVAGAQPANSTSFVYATQTDAPSPDYATMLARPEVTPPRFEIERRATAPLPAEAKAVGELWVNRLQKHGALSGYSRAAEGGPIDSLFTLFTAREFDSWLAENGWRAPTHVTWRFQDELIAPRVSDAAAPMIRFWPAHHGRTGVPPTLVANYGRVLVRDGCFYVRSPGGPEQLAWFNAETGLARDGQGYLVLVSRQTGEAVARLGEDMIWQGSNYIAPDDPQLAPLRQACGPGEVAAVGSPGSLKRFYFQNPRLRNSGSPLPVGPPPGVSADQER